METVLKFIEENHQRYLGELTDLLAIPSISTNAENSKDIGRCAQWLADHLAATGMEHVHIYPTKGHPIVYADWLHAPGSPTLLIYGHYDVQPVDPLELWTSPPFTATIRGRNLYARGSSDDKGQLFIHLKAIEAFFRTEGKLPLNIKIIFEGEEEIGSEHLESFVAKNKKLLKSDLVLISDTSMYAHGVPSVCYSLRGLSYAQVEITGPDKDLHSGSFGGALHNPIQALSEMIASLHDRNGRVTIPGFYDSVIPLTPAERKAFKKLPWSDAKFAKELGVKQLYGEKGYSSLERLWARPTLECNGIWGGFTGEGAKTVIPSKAYAKISMRLVAAQDSAKIGILFEKHIKAIAPPSVKVKVTIIHGGEPVLTPIDSPGVKTAVSALAKGFGKKPLYQREGGSIPIVVQFKKLLGADSVLLGFGLPDENSHAPDEFLNLDNFFGGIRTSAYFYNDLASFMKQGKKKG
jgi:acetylornithine deacetylase/succinyl-diaminopimelate desuccinylase-like protein